MVIEKLSCGSSCLVKKVNGTKRRYRHYFAPCLPCVSPKSHLISGSMTDGRCVAGVPDVGYLQQLPPIARAASVPMAAALNFLFFVGASQLRTMHFAPSRCFSKRFSDSNTEQLLAALLHHGLALLLFHYSQLHFSCFKSPATCRLYTGSGVENQVCTSNPHLDGLNAFKRL